MSAFTPTAAQRAAIESRGSAVLVSAGAGSGKTKVLTERLMGYLTDREHPKDIDSFLVITFTRAAAGELKGRIMDELSKAIAADPANRHLRRQSALIPRPRVGSGPRSSARPCAGFPHHRGRPRRSHEERCA